MAFRFPLSGPRLALGLLLRSFLLTLGFLLGRLLRLFLLLGELRLLRLELGPFPRKLLGGGVLLALVLNHLEGALAVDRVAVLRHERCLPLNHSGFRLVGRRRHEALRRQDLRVFHDGGLAVRIEEAHERLARAELHDGVLALEVRVCAERLGRRFHRLLLGGSVGAQAVLHAVGKLR